MNPWAKAPEEIGSWYLEEVKKWCAKQEGTILVAEHDAQLLGYATVLCRFEEEGAGGVLYQQWQTTRFGVHYELWRQF